MKKIYYNSFFLCIFAPIFRPKSQVAVCEKLILCANCPFPSVAWSFLLDLLSLPPLLLTLLWPFRFPLQLLLIQSEPPLSLVLQASVTAAPTVLSHSMHSCVAHSAPFMSACFSVYICNLTPQANASSRPSVKSSGSCHSANF